MSAIQSDFVRQSSSSVILVAETVRQELENKLLASNTAVKVVERPTKVQNSATTAIDASEKFREIEEHKMPIAELLRLLEVDSVDVGLSGEIARRRLEMEGPNTLTEKKPTPWYVILWHCVTNIFSLLLWAGSILCFIVYAVLPQDPSTLYTALVILTVIWGVGISSFYQEMRSRSIMASFKNFTPPICSVIRDGELSSLAAAQLVRGDVLLLKAGDKVPADIRIVTSIDMKVDNASLTGESEPQVRKAECTHPDNPFETQNLAFFGTLVVEGKCTGVVVFTGDSTFMGRIANLASTATNDLTTLQKEINSFIKLISSIALTLGAIFLAIGIYVTMDVIATLSFCIGVIVANVPEGLMTALTVSVVLSAKRMLKCNVLVKNLQSVETMGSISCICSDKTGTLTENKMTVVHLWYDGQVIEADNLERAGKGKLKYNTEASSFQMFQRCAVLCSDSVFDRGVPSSVTSDLQNDPTLSAAVREVAIDAKRREYLEALDRKPWFERPTTGNASEGALIKFFQPIADIVKFRQEQPLAEHGSEKIVVPFNSTNKYQLSLHKPASWQTDGHANDHVLYMKGAPEKIWALCSKILVNGVEQSISPEWQQKYDQANLFMANLGERVLGFGYLYLPAEDFPPNYPWSANPGNFPMAGLTFIGLAALEDPPRKGVARAVEQCQTAGIKVVMVTGDQPVTAAAIARKCNIITGITANELAEQRGCNFEDVLDEVEAVVIHGNDLARATAEDESLPEDAKGARMARWLSKKQVVFARTTPAQKLIIVKGHQTIGHIVAVTGDGVNDSPAIKQADIGIAMNLVGSDVAKDSADMLLLDDNFCSIVDGIEQGRLMFDNLKKTIIYVLVVNIPELVPIWSFIALGFPKPLTTIFMLLICVVTDILPAISFAYEKKELDIMRRKPRNADVDHLVTWKLMFHAYANLGIIEMFGGMYTYFVVMHDFGFETDFLFGLYFRKGCKPASTDVYDPTLPNNGNTMVATCSKATPSWIDTSNANIDLRLWFYDSSESDWSTCQYPGLESQIKSGAYYCYSTEALFAAQGAYFCALVTMQWIDVLVNKTRILNLWHQGLSNTVANIGLMLETVVCLLVIYVPGLNEGVGGRPLMPLHIFVPAMPFAIFFFIFDEGRKFCNRMYKDHFGRAGAIEKIGQY